DEAGQGDQGVSVAFVQGGSCPEGIQAEIRSIASLYLEPVWVFYRGEPGAQLPSLRGKRIAIGPEGSGTRAMALRLLKASGALAAGAATNPSATSAPATAAATAQADDPDLLPFVGRPAT